MIRSRSAHPVLTRRALLGGVALAGAVTAISSCKAPDAGSTAASEDSLTIGIPGGSLSKWIRGVVEDFQKDSGISVAIEEGVSADFVAKLKAGGKRAPYSMVTLDENFVVSSAKADLLQPMPDGIANLEHLFEEAVVHERHGLGLALSRDTIYVNKGDLNGPAPTAYDGLLRPSLIKRVAIPHLRLGVGVEFLTGMAAAATGSDFATAQSDLEPGLKLLGKHRGEFRTIYTGINDILPQLSQGEIWATFGKSRQVNDVIRAEAPVEQAPIKAAFGGFNCAAIPAAAPNPDAAAQLIDTLLSRSAQERMIEIAGAGPTNTTAKVPAGTVGDIPTVDDLEELTFLDWTKINPQLPALLDRFNKAVVQ